MVRESERNQGVNVEQVSQGRSFMADLLRKVRQDFLNLFAAQLGSIRPRTEDRKPSNRVGHDFGLVRPFFARRQNNASSFDIGLQRIPRADAQPPPQRPRKHNLTFRRNLSLHGKTILPIHAWSRNLKVAPASRRLSRGRFARAKQRCQPSS
jgi:hypothetical protein